MTNAIISGKSATCRRRRRRNRNKRRRLFPYLQQNSFIGPQSSNSSQFRLKSIVSVKETHQMAELNAERNNRFKNALKIGEDSRKPKQANEQIEANIKRYSPEQPIDLNKIESDSKSHKRKADELKEKTRKKHRSHHSSDSSSDDSDESDSESESRKKKHSSKSSSKRKDKKPHSKRHQKHHRSSRRSYSSDSASDSDSSSDSSSSESSSNSSKSDISHDSKHNKYSHKHHRKYSSSPEPSHKSKNHRSRKVSIHFSYFTF